MPGPGPSAADPRWVDHDEPLTLGKGVFRALLEIDVELRPLTVLVGPNDSGKSSFLEAIHSKLTKRTLDSSDGWRGIQTPVVKKGAPQGPATRQP